MKNLINFIAISFFVYGCSTNKNAERIEDDQKALEQTSVEIRAAFAKGDVSRIISYHHPKVVKALGYNNFLNGREAVEANLKETLENFTLNFKENKVESLLIEGDIATEMVLFTIEGTPKVKGKPFVFKGRAIVVYIRYKPSPSGWASIREVIQPATE
jgi:ketosteroid isomerase-like protein